MWIYIFEGKFWMFSWVFGAIQLHPIQRWSLPLPLSIPASELWSGIVHGCLAAVSSSINTSCQNHGFGLHCQGSRKIWESYLYYLFVMEKKKKKKEIAVFALINRENLGEQILVGLGTIFFHRGKGRIKLSGRVITSRLSPSDRRERGALGVSLWGKVYMDGPDLTSCS